MYRILTDTGQRVTDLWIVGEERVVGPQSGAPPVVEGGFQPRG